MIEKIIIPVAISIIANVDEHKNLVVIQNTSEYKNIKNENFEIKEQPKEIVKIPKSTKKQIQEKVIGIIVEKLGITVENVNLKSHFTDDLGADSLDFVELIIEFEKQFNIFIPDEIAEKITTVGQTVDYIFEIYNNPIVLYSEDKFKGRIKMTTSSYTCYSSQYDIVENGLSSIIIPKGYIVYLYTDIKYTGSYIKINATTKKIKIKNISEINENSSISFSNDIKNWDDKIKSIKIKKTI